MVTYLGEVSTPFGLNLMLKITYLHVKLVLVTGNCIFSVLKIINPTEVNTAFKA